MINKFRKSFSNLFRMQSLLENKLILSNLQQRALHGKEIGVTHDISADKPILVSLTTYGKKIYEVHLVIESIFQQTVRPNKVVLWLSDEYFSMETLPIVLKQQMKRGLEIRFCKDIRSYTKVLYAFAEYAGYHIISIDDDIVYPFDMIERFVAAYRQDSRKIYFNKGHRMLMDGREKRMRPYIDWCKEGYTEGSSLLNLPLGVYGIFYPDGLMNKEVLNKAVFMDICPLADDIWFKAMSLLDRIECASVSQGAVNMNDFISIELNREKSLARTNVDMGANDSQIQKVFNRYGIFEILRDETHR